MKQKRIILIGYKIGSRSLKNMQQDLKEDQQDRRVLRVRKNSLRYKRRVSDKVVFWGPVAECPHADPAQEAAKKRASNKLLSFRAFKEHGVRTPEWTIDVEVANAWGKMFVGRKLLCSHSGKGIVIYDPAYPQAEGGNYPAVIGDAKLYVQYKKKKHEYRVHVFEGSVIDVTQKKKRVGHEETNHQIRNHQNGWVYCREGIQEPADLRQLALDACAALGLHSGAVDIIWNEKENLSYVLEVNTAPGIEGTTCKNYTNKIIEGIV